MRPFVFVIMPFHEDFRDAYEFGIKPACVDAGAECERVDEQIFLQNILERIYGQIRKADIVIAEMTGRNANVFYETGYAHGIAKPVILVTQSADDIPFDLKHYPHVVYGKSIATLKRELEKKVRWLVEHPAERKAAGGLTKDAVGLDAQRMEQHITNYLKENGFTKVSFGRLRENVNPNYTDKILLDLIDSSPDRFRRVRLSGGRPGIGLLSR